MYHYLKKRFLKAQDQAPCFSQEYKREESQPPPHIQNLYLFSQGQMRGAQPPPQHQNQNILLQGQMRGAQPPPQHQNLNILLQGYMRGAQLPSQHQKPNIPLQVHAREATQLPMQSQNPNPILQGHTREGAQPPQNQNLNLLLQGHKREDIQPPSQIQNLNLLSQGHKREGARHKREEARRKREEEEQGSVHNLNLPTLRNVVSTANLGCKLDLREIALKVRNTEYNPRKISAAIMRIRKPRTTALIFESGKIVCAGAKSEELSKKACRKFARILQKLGNDVKVKHIIFQNVVASYNCRFPINLENLAGVHQSFCSYEPELFTGLRYHMKVPKVDILIFTSGRIVLTGGKTREHLYEAFEKILPVLMEFRKPRITF